MREIDSKKGEKSKAVQLWPIEVVFYLLSYGIDRTCRAIIPDRRKERKAPRIISGGFMLVTTFVA